MKSPNIFLLVMDTARASNFPMYGYDRNTSPNLSEMASEGILFERSYSNCIWTLPSHHSIFTGKLPSHHGAISKEESKTSLETLPEVLGENGYCTYAVSNNGWVSSKGGFEEMFSDFNFLGRAFDLEDRMLFEKDDLFREVHEKEKEGEWENKINKYFYTLKESFKRSSPQTLFNGLYYLLNRESESWRDGAEKANSAMLKKLKTSEKPFFGFINYVEPHDPYTPPKEFAEEFLGDVSYERAMEVSKNANLVDMLAEKSGNETGQVLQNLYDAEIKYLDEKIGQLVEEIEEKTERENVFIITSDHGENFNEEGKNLWGHYGMITEDLIHVPLLIKGLGNKKVKENFSLRKLKKLIESISEGNLKIETQDKVITEYWGLDSHNWGLVEKNFDSRYFQNQKSVFENSLYILGEDFEEGKNNKDYLMLRCGNP